MPGTPFSSAMRALLIHNPDAGTGRHSPDKLIDLLKKEGISASYYSTQDEGYSDALRHAADLVVVAGGDGTVAKVADDLADRNVPIAIIPLGTANNIACSLGIPRKPKRAVGGLRSATSRALDVAMASGPWGRRLFLEAVGAGAFADAVAALDQNSDQKRKRSAMLKRAREGFRKILREAAPTRVRLSADGHHLPSDVLLVEVMNIARMGPRLRLAAAADPGDGRVDVVLLPTGRREEMLDWLRSEDDDVPAPVTTIRASNVSIDRNGSRLRIGDEMAPDKCVGSVYVELDPERLQVLVPTEER